MPAYKGKDFKLGHYKLSALDKPQPQAGLSSNHRSLIAFRILGNS